MFTRVLDWLKGVWSKMIGTSNVKEKLGIDIAVRPSWRPRSRLGA